jgi:glycosyltransferase involved in cell wall biosynthesis
MQSLASTSLKVIHVSQRDDPAAGGAVRVAFELVRRLSEHNVSARIVFLYGDEGYFGTRLARQRDYLHIRNSSDVFSLGRLNRYLRRERPDIVHFHDDLLWPQLLTAGRRPWKAVIHAHGGGTAAPQPLKTRLLYACQRRTTDAVVCITEEARTSQMRNVGFTPRILHVVSNGVDTERFRPASLDQRRHAREILGLPLESPVVGFVGRLHDATKGCTDFLRILAALPQCYVGLVVGSGPDAEALRRQAKVLGLAARVRFAGMLNDTLAAYQCMDVFCFTSHLEGFGLTIAEAMACRVPVVGFSCPGGSGEILTNETGCVIDRRDVVAMANAVEHAARHESPWPTRVIAASEMIERRYRWAASAQALANLYRSLTDSTAPN